MNICFFALNIKEETSVGAAVGGIERASTLLAKELRRRGYNVEFYSFPSPLPSFFCSLFPKLSKRAYYEKVRFCKFLKEHKIDVVVLHWGSWRIPFPLKNLPCRLITMWHSSPTFSEQFCVNAVVEKLKTRSRLPLAIVRSKPCRFFMWNFFRFCYFYSFSYILHCCDKFVLLSKEFFPDFPLVKRFPDKVCAIPNIAPLVVENVDFTTKKKELLWVGRVEFNPKRPDFMLQIWQRLQDRFPDWSLRFVGDGSYLPELKALAKELGVQRVFFEGFQDPRLYYCSASIFCLTSAWEGFGLVLVEAQAYGCVPVAFASSNVFRDIIEDSTSGFLVPAFDVEKYAEKLHELMSDHELRERLAFNASKSVAKFSAEAIGDKWEKLLQEVQAR